MDEPGIKGYYCEKNIERLRRCEEVSAKKGVIVPQLALAWILNQKMNVFALTAPVTEEQIKVNSVAAEIKLTDEEIKYLNLE